MSQISSTQNSKGNLYSLVLCAILIALSFCPRYGQDHSDALRRLDHAVQYAGSDRPPATSADRNGVSLQALRSVC